jgi:hypothetical protein
MYGHSDASFWRWLLAVVLGHPLITNGPSCTTLHRAILHNSHLRINSVRKGSTFSRNASSEIQRNELQLQNCSNTNGSLQSNHKFQLIQELQAIVAHQATRTQEAASDKAVCALQWVLCCFVYSGFAHGRQIYSQWFRRKMVAFLLFNVMQHTKRFWHTEASAMSQEFGFVGMHASIWHGLTKLFS